MKNTENMLHKIINWYIKSSIGAIIIIHGIFAHGLLLLFGWISSDIFDFPIMPRPYRNFVLFMYFWILGSGSWPLFFMREKYYHPEDPSWVKWLNYFCGVLWLAINIIGCVVSIWI
jgi:hypothetical protein